MARSKQDRRKKTAAAHKAAPQADNTRPEAGIADAHAAELSPNAVQTRGRQKSTARQGDGARTSTILLIAVLCLLLGIYLGTLLPAFRGFNELVASIQPSPPKQQPQSIPPARLDAGGNGRLHELEEAAGKNPQDLHAWIQLGNQYFDDHKPREAIRAYERALAIKGDNPDVLTDMGIMYRLLGEFERAAEHFTQASKISPLHEQSRFNLGVVLFFDLKRKDEARKIWRALIAINPETKTPDGALLRTMLDELQ